VLHASEGQILKFIGKALLALLLVLTAAYYYVSASQPTIDVISNPLAVNNLHLIDEDPASGFAIYRLGEPSEEDVRALCELGISEMVVLAGTALNHEIAYRDQCPQLELIYNHEDDLSPLSGQWLQYFDNWVARAKAEGRKIAFRCTCGCHRTGRLAAYYQMKYRGFSAKDAWDLAQARGIAMHVVDYFSSLQQQIIALHEYIQDQPCSQGEFCVVQQSPVQVACDDPLQGCGWHTEVL